MNKRIQEVRKRAGLNQDDFAAKLNLTKNYISLVENGKRDPSDRTITDICRTFGVRKDWLITGIGDMREPATRQQDIAEVAIAMRNADPESARYQIMKMLAQMSDDDIDVIYRLTLTLAGMLDKNKPQE